MASADGDQVSALFGRFAVGPIGYFGALGIAFLIAVMTALTSRLTVYQLPRRDGLMRLSAEPCAVFLLRYEPR